MHGFAAGNVAGTLVALPPVLGALPTRVTLRLGQRWQRKGDRWDQDHRGPNF